MTEFNRHHFGFDRRGWSRDSLANKLRTNLGMIALLEVGVHRDLHANIQPIAPPIRSLSNLILAHLQEVQSPEPIINLANVSGFLFRTSEYAGDGRLAEDAFRVGSFYLDQALFLNENRR